MRIKLMLLVLVIVGLATAGHAQGWTPPPQTPSWFVEEYPSWNLAVAKIVQKNGDVNWYALPIDGKRWIVIRREMSGGDVYHVGYGVKSFGTIGEAAAYYSSLTNPVKRILDWHDGTALVLWKCGAYQACN